MSVFTNPSKVITNFLHMFDAVGQQILEFAKPTIKMLERDGRKALIAAATAAVAQAQAMDLSNSDKRDAALKIIEAGVAAAGLTFVESEARVVLEMAVQALKGAA